MIVSQFRIATDYTPPRRWFWVRIYDTEEALRKVSNRVHQLGGGVTGEYDDCVGCVQEVTPWLPEDVDPDAQDRVAIDVLDWPGSGFAGVVRLCEQWLTTEVIAHEIFHAAVVVFRMNIRQRPMLEGMLDPERPNEEALAYAVGQLSEAVHIGLREGGFEKQAVD